MCGITGFVSNKPNKELIESITKSMSHRGPDSVTTSIHNIGNSYLHLGSSRLSITGLADGDMPMEDKDGNVIVYNGEIYELSKLRSQYSLKINSKSDTRHLLNILSSQNINEVNNLNGMFAYAYFDKRNNKLFIGRDKLGIKPLYFGSNKNFKFYFSSEIKPLLENGLINNKLNENLIKNYLYLGGITCFEGMFAELTSQLPGSYTLFENERITENIRLEASSSLNKNTTNKDFNEIFKDSLDDQLTAEVPVNILLSGGIDSSLIALYAKKHLDRDVTAYTLGYQDQFYNETSQAQDVSSKLGIELVKFEFPENRNDEIIDELLDKLPEPIADASTIPNYYLAQKVSEFTKVVISGDGADELFGGYEWHRGALISEYTPSMVSPLLNLFLKFYKSQSNYISFEEKAKLFSLGNNLSIPEKIMLWQNYIPSEEMGDQILLYKDYIEKLGFNKKFDFNDLRNLDIKNYLYSNILKKSDITWMLNSVEVRPIFLDSRIVDFAFETDLRNNLKFLETKSFLKKILRNEIKDYNFQKKHGFSHDFGDWTYNVGLKYLEKEWSELEEVKRLISYLKNNKENKYFVSRYVWKFYSLFRWMEKNKISV